MPVESEFLTTGEVALLLRIPQATLYAWRYRGDGPPAYRLGRHLRWRRAEVEAWLRDQRDGHGPA